MRHKIVASLFVSMCVCSFTFAQNFTLNTSYQLSKYGEYYGVTGSRWITTWNNDKVILRGTAGFFAGNHWGERSTVHDFQRIELGLESRNTMVTGKDFFNVIGAGHSFASYNQTGTKGLERVKNNGWFFSFGFGTKLTSPVVVMARYVWGIEKGIRLGMEFDF